MIVVFFSARSLEGSELHFCGGALSFEGGCDTQQLATR
jgi:hypothetical protein